jgi:membrane-associated phospholipid phosphatase
MVGFGVVLALGILFAGLVGTARLALKAHSPAELYIGYGVGCVAILIGQALV